MSLSKARSKEETEEIYELAQFISDYNMRKGSIDERFPPYESAIAMALYDEGYRKTAPRRGVRVHRGERAAARFSPGGPAPRNREIAPVKNRMEVRQHE